MQFTKYRNLLLVFLMLPWLISFLVPVAVFWISIYWLKIDDGSTLNWILTIAANGLVLLLYFSVARRITSTAGRAIDDSRNNARDKKDAVSIGTKRHRIYLLSLFAVIIASLFYSLVCKLTNHPTGTGHLAIYYIFPFFLGPLSEEYLFRKAMHVYCKRNGIEHYLTFSAILFALIQGYDMTIASLVDLFITMAFAFFFLAIPYSLTLSLPGVIMVHIFWNAMLVLSPYLIMQVPAQSLFQYLIFIAIIFIVLCLLSLKTYRAAISHESDQ